MTLSFAPKSSRLPLSAVARSVAQPLTVPDRPPAAAAAGSGRTAFAQVVGAGLDAALAQPPGRALRRALGADLDRPTAQAAAHREAVAYGRQRAGLFGAALPLLSALRQRMGYGVTEGDVRGRDRLAALAAPLLGLIARQFSRIDARVVVPQEKVDLLNRIDAGAGDALRRRVERAQAEIGDVRSAASLRMHRAALDALAVPPPTRPGAPAALELAQLASAASAIGTAMVMRHSAATVAVAEAGALRLRAEQAPAVDGTAGLSAEPVPLFYANQAGTASASATVADPAQRKRLGGMLAAVEQDTQALAGVARALRRPLARLGGARPAHWPAPPADVPVLATLCDVVAVGVHRDDLVAAQPPTALYVPGAQARVAEGPARRAILAMGHAVGMYAAARPWFLPSPSPASDA